jgi:ribonuclease VapC
LIVDTSALLAVMLEEDDSDRFLDAITFAESASISAVSHFEAAMIIERRSDGVASKRFDDIERLMKLRVVEFTPTQALLARQAWRRFGKGSDNPAQLNYGDCMVYALAKDTGQPLLFKGNDFSQTDIEPALKD